MKMPKLRFKTDDDSDFPEWESFVLNEVCNYSTSRGNGKNYVSTENMLKDFAGVNISPDKEANGIIYQLNDILLSNIRPYLKKAWLANCNGVCSSDVLVLRPTNVEPCLLYYLIANDTFINYVMMSVSGTKMPRGDKTSIMNWKLVLPCHEEQRKIANFLLAVDDIIDKQQAEIKAWEQYKKGLTQKLFSQEVRFKADDGSDFPAWDSMNFGNVFDEISNNTLARAKLSDESGQAKNIHYGDIHTKFGEILDLKKEILPYIIPEVDCSRMMPLQDGDIVLADTAEDNTVGKAVEVHNVGSNVLYAGLHTIARRPKFKFAPKYLGYYINSNAYHDQLIPYMQGTKQPAISKAHILLTHIQIPSIKEQSKIAECLDAIDEVITLAKAELAKWRELKKGLLQQLFV